MARASRVTDRAVNGPPPAPPRLPSAAVDLSPTASEQEFRAELRGWLRDHLPWEYGTGLPPRFDDLAEEVAFLRRWQSSLAAGRWIGVSWPPEFGGRGTGPAVHYIVHAVLARARGT